MAWALLPANLQRGPPASVLPTFLQKAHDGLSLCCPGYCVLFEAPASFYFSGNLEIGPISLSPRLTETRNLSSSEAAENSHRISCLRLRGHNTVAMEISSLIFQSNTFQKKRMIHRSFHEDQSQSLGMTWCNRV